MEVHIVSFTCLVLVGFLQLSLAAPERNGHKDTLTFTPEQKWSFSPSLKWTLPEIFQMFSPDKPKSDLDSMSDTGFENDLKSNFERIGLQYISGLKSLWDSSKVKGNEVLRDSEKTLKTDIVDILRKAKGGAESAKENLETGTLRVAQIVHELGEKMGYKGKFTCELCKTGVGLVQLLVATKASHDTVKSLVYEACKTLKIETDRVCKGLVDEFAPEILTVLDQLVLSPSEICGVVFGSECGDPYNPLDDWNVTFPNTSQPTPVYPTPPKKGSPTLRVLHLTDIHYDSEYMEGSNANCGEPLCCRKSSGTPSNETNKAWKFGDYRSCDTPLWTLEHMFATLAAQNDTFDYIIWTGDLPAHNVWNQSKAAQLDTMQHVVGLFLKYFPGKPVYPSLGNHESSPVNSYPPPYITGEYSISWLYEALADAWKQWLPKDALDSVRRGAYYTVSPHPGFRIISLNMNYCNNENWWMLLNTTDPAGELQWMISTLQKSEDTGEKVHIIGHIPPGIDDCLKAWSWNYYKIVSRYQNTIAGQFFGHVHMDNFEVFYDVETLKIPVGVAYVSPSVTPYSNFNMGYRFYTIDGVYKNSSYQVLDHETFYLNLTKAHIEDKITWEFEYSAKAAYNMTGVYPKDWDKMITEMKTNQTLLDRYNKYNTKSRGSGTCDAECRKTMLCQARSGRSHDPSLCKDLGVDTAEDWKKMFTRSGKFC